MASKKKRPIQVVDLDAALEHLKLLIYGAPKTGKTVLAASASTCESAAPVLFCDVEAGVVSLRSAPVKLVDKDNLKVVSITEFEDFNAVYDILYNNPGRFKTVIIDSISEVHHLAMAAEMKLVVLKDPTREEWVPSRREWGIVRAQIRKLVREFRGLPINLVLNCSLRLEEDEMSGVTNRYPQLPGQLRMEIPGYCDVVALLEVTAPRRKKSQVAVLAQRVLHLDQIPRAVTGTRGWEVPSKLINPTFADIQKAVLGG